MNAFWQQFPDRFGVDFVGRISTTLSQISGGRVVEIPPGMDGAGNYSAATFKHLVPGQGEFKAHCGNYFHKEFPAFYRHMKEISRIENQMSYFVMLSQADIGGELTLFDIEWSEAEIREKGDTTLVTKKGKRRDLLNPNDVRRTQYAPNPGDMFVFAGGQIWHRVEKVTGVKPRYTIGGFMTRSADDRSLYIWS